MLYDRDGDQHYDHISAMIKSIEIPDELDERLSPEVEAALPGVAARVKELALEPFTNS